MLKISGVGDVKMDKYGLDFLRTVKDYCLENNEKSRINLKTPKREPKKRTKRNADGDDTYTITLKMFRGGATIEEIAEERNLSPNTIETHLVRFIPTGEVKLTEIVAEEKIETIRKAILELNAENGNPSDQRIFRRRFFLRRDSRSRGGFYANRSGGGKMTGAQASRLRSSLCFLFIAVFRF